MINVLINNVMKRKNLHNTLKMTNQPYHLMFNEIPEEVLNSVKQAIKKGLFKKDKETRDKLLILGNLSDELCNYYHIDKCRIIISSFPFAPCYNQEHKQIILNKISLVSFLHEFYHHLSNSNESFENNEDNSRGWSHSVLFLATPNLLNNALNKNLLTFENADGNKTGERQ